MSWFGETLATIAMTFGLGASGGPVAHGYVEGEYLRIAAPVAGFLESLPVSRGQRIDKGAALFAIDSAVPLAERDRLAAALSQARSQLSDLRTGKRPEEIDVILAQKDQAEATLRRAKSDLERQQALIRHYVSTDEKVDIARSTYEQTIGRIEELKAQLAAARLPARPEQIRAAEDGVRVAEAALLQQERRLAEMAPRAPVGALVEDTLYNPGEWVPAGSPVVSLLPPDKIKLVVYVPEPLLSSVKPGQTRPVTCDGCAAGIKARVTYVSPKAEYTPPVIYSVGSREKLVYRVELAPERAGVLTPGLPVDVEIGP